MGNIVLAENGPEIGPALGESMSQTMGENVLSENGPAMAIFSPVMGESALLDEGSFQVSEIPSSLKG